MSRNDWPVNEMEFCCPHCDTVLSVEVCEIDECGTGYADAVCLRCRGKWRYVKSNEFQPWELAITLRFWSEHLLGGLDWEERLEFLAKEGYEWPATWKQLELWQGM